MKRLKRIAFTVVITFLCILIYANDVAADNMTSAGTEKVEVGITFTSDTISQEEENSTQTTDTKPEDNINQEKEGGLLPKLGGEMSERWTILGSILTLFMVFFLLWKKEDHE
ncbi:hypothetical protein [Enterococcus casseliflavus]|uniref:hypothetical protein n=1 Tax=Enterococcus casseliflavus TaxID=37734 RepID=UPI00232D6410|nr:hypothetical protein [Enterococcus casseliflavus]MDB1688383.1 hypothetical protein [Enterococcus casseliflavus]